MGSLVHNNGISPEPKEEEGGWGSDIDESCVVKKGNGAYLTWKELQVAVLSKSNNGEDGCKPILRGVTSYAKPGEVVAIMGPSGCGNSTLLDDLATKLITHSH